MIPRDHRSNIVVVVKYFKCLLRSLTEGTSAPEGSQHLWQHGFENGYFLFNFWSSCISKHFIDRRETWEWKKPRSYQPFFFVMNVNKENDRVHLSFVISLPSPPSNARYSSLLQLNDSPESKCRYYDNIIKELL